MDMLQLSGLGVGWVLHLLSQSDRRSREHHFLFAPPQCERKVVLDVVFGGACPGEGRPKVMFGPITCKRGLNSRPNNPSRSGVYWDSDLDDHFFLPREEVSPQVSQERKRMKMTVIGLMLGASNSPPPRAAPTLLWRTCALIANHQL